MSSRELNKWLRAQSVFRMAEIFQKMWYKMTPEQKEEIYKKFNKKYYRA